MPRVEIGLQRVVSGEISLYGVRAQRRVRRLRATHRLGQDTGGSLHLRLRSDRGRPGGVRPAVPRGRGQHSLSLSLTEPTSGPTEGRRADPRPATCLSTLSLHCKHCITFYASAMTIRHPPVPLPWVRPQRPRPRKRQVPRQGCLRKGCCGAPAGPGAENHRDSLASTWFELLGVGACRRPHHSHGRAATAVGFALLARAAVPNTLDRRSRGNTHYTLYRDYDCIRQPSCRPRRRAYGPQTAGRGYPSTARPADTVDSMLSKHLAGHRRMQDDGGENS